MSPLTASIVWVDLKPTENDKLHLDAPLAVTLRRSGIFISIHTLIASAVNSNLNDGFAEPVMPCDVAK